MTFPTCATCRRPMRPHNTLAIDYPNTVSTHNAHTCRTCERRYRRTGVAPAVATVQIDAGDDWNLHRPDLCGSDDFFPDDKDGKNPLYTVARAVCASCPVRELGCKPFIFKAESGMTRYARHGFAAGMTAGERAKADPEARGTRPIKHGTEGGASAHRRRGEPTCDACKKADMLAGQRRREAAASGRIPVKVPVPIDHGTPAGYYGHKRRKERICEPCRLAKNAREAELARERRNVKAQARKVTQVDTVAEIMAAAEVERQVAVGVYGNGWAAA